MFIYLTYGNMTNAETLGTNRHIDTTPEGICLSLSIRSHLTGVVLSKCSPLLYMIAVFVVTHTLLTFA